MKTYIFSCENCKHADIADGIQTGCSLHKLQSFIDQEKASLNPESNFYDLNRVCLSKNSDEVALKTKIGYVFILNEVSKLETLKENIHLCLENNPVWIGVVHNLPEANDNIIEYFKDVPCLHNIICNYDLIDDIYKPDQLLKKYKNGWTIVNVVGEEFNKDLCLTLENYISNNEQPVGLIKDEGESVNNFCFFNIIYKFLKGSKPDINEETDEVTFATYEEKIMAMSPDMIKTWKEIYEINRNSSN